MYQLLVAFIIRRVAEKTAFFTEAIACAGRPTWLIRGNVIGAEEPAS
ncbi:hypothetical protein ACQPZQ_20250 [Pseudonocardia sp. CA-142604]